MHGATIKIMEGSVPKRRHIKFRRRGITQKKECNVQNTAKVWNQNTKILQLVEIYPEIYGNRTLITMFTTARHCSVSCVQWRHVCCRLISYTKHETQNKRSSFEVLTAKFRNSYVFREVTSCHWAISEGHRRALTDISHNTWIFWKNK